VGGRWGDNWTWAQIGGARAGGRENRMPRAEGAFFHSQLGGRTKGQREGMWTAAYVIMEGSERKRLQRKKMVDSHRKLGLKGGARVGRG